MVFITLEYTIKINVFWMMVKSMFFIIFFEKHSKIKSSIHFVDSVSRRMFVIMICAICYSAFHQLYRQAWVDDKNRKIKMWKKKKVIQPEINSKVMAFAMILLVFPNNFTFFSHHNVWSVTVSCTSFIHKLSAACTPNTAYLS